MENKLDIEYYSLLAERIRNHDTEAFTEFYYAPGNLCPRFPENSRSALSDSAEIPYHH